MHVDRPPSALFFWLWDSKPVCLPLLIFQSFPLIPSVLFPEFVMNLSVQKQGERSLRVLSLLQVATYLGTLGKERNLT